MKFKLLFQHVKNKDIQYIFVYVDIVTIQTM